MSYTVLARKWRPKNFAELVGQSHVMQALSNALDQNRLHHAYLFTGTRGVGKTTIARIFSKALNCQEGISSTPCGVCETCRAIDEGRFIDLIEVDAASRTKVDDTREILDNVQFAPTQGRYKVYLIDEVHMLSKSSFNALLKTLEEPPEHVKFLLATTDPHKLPITVLSRCLQFNLMRLTQTQLQGHLESVLQQENIPFESSALALIAKSADGSARDALSLLDQAIAYGAGEIHFEPVQTMLGLVDQQFTVAILEALAEESPQQVKELIQQLAAMGIDYSALLAQLIETLHALAFNQVLGGTTDSSLLPEEVIVSLVQKLSADRVQLLYQITLLAKQDMQLAPDIRIGFEMALMRMLAFQPGSSGVTEGSTDSQVSNQQGGAQLTASQSKVNTPSHSSDEPLLQDADPQTVLSGLSSARALMAKKKESDVTTAISNQAEDTKAESLVPQSEPSAAPKNQPISQPVGQEEGGTTRPALTSQANDVNVDAFNNIAPVMDDSPPWDMPEQPAQMQQPAVQTVTTQQEAHNVTDHLSQIKQRLKQPLGKSQSEIEPKSVQSEPLSNDSFNASENKSYSVNVLQSQVLQPEGMSTRNVDSIPDRVSNPSLEQQADQQESLNQQFDGNALVEPIVSEVEKTAPSQDESKVIAELEYVALTDDNRLQVWLGLLERLKPEGMAAELARQSILVDYSPDVWKLSVDPQQAYAKTDMAVLRLKEVLHQAFGEQIVLEFIGFQQHDTPAKYEQQLAVEKQSQAEASIHRDPLVASFKNELGFEVIQNSISPV
ncbi:MAG: DNA polymerase III subunit gamma/tau [Pseudomonadota bacterium]|nr:DNA polymerase III subunit gamma/tau [Pseudomonadota bacterium]